jgi:hypothetical protein
MIIATGGEGCQRFRTVGNTLYGQSAEVMLYWPLITVDSRRILVTGQATQ